MYLFKILYLSSSQQKNLQAPIFTELRQLSLTQLNEIFLELEVLIREFSETLIAELALRDELEYEKELKNTFISLLLAVQNKRRQYHIEKKKRPGAPRSPSVNSCSSESKVPFAPLYCTVRVLCIVIL